MKFMTLFFLLSVGAFAQLEQNPLDVINNQCELAHGFDGPHSCALQKAHDEIPGHQILLGLHYGDAFTESVEVEILREEVTEEQLKDFAAQFKVKIQVSTEDFSLKFRTLSAVVKDNKIIFPMGDTPQGSFFIASLLVELNRENQSMDYLVRDIFGPRALAVMTPVRRTSK